MDLNRRSEMVENIAAAMMQQKPIGAGGLV